MAKKITRYSCAICSQEYESKADAERCESKKPLKILPCGKAYYAAHGKNDTHCFVLFEKIGVARYTHENQYRAVGLGVIANEATWWIEELTVSENEETLREMTDSRRLTDSDIEKSLYKSDINLIKERGYDGWREYLNNPDK